MKVSPELIPSCEAERIIAVHRYEILDTPSDGAFDRLTKLAIRLFKVPVSIISIVDEERIWFKSHQGVEVEEINRDPGLCASAILQDDVWEIKDAKIDPRTLSNPLVAGEFGLRFYAGVALKTSDGYNLGTICIIDREPRELTENERLTLQDLAAIVMSELDLRLAVRNIVKVERLARLLAEEEKTHAQKLATIDMLTGLGNRRAFDLDLEKQLKNTSSALAIAMIDLNGLKKVNDFRGHDMGDSLLRQFGSSLQKTIRKQDKAYRFGGDEFAVLLSGVTIDNIPFLKERIREAMGEVQKHGFPETSVSIGIATLAEVEGIPYKAVRLADVRMYSEKAEYYRQNHGK